LRFVPRGSTLNEYETVSDREDPAMSDDRTPDDRTPVSRRSRLTPERELELYRAVAELLRELGYEALTMDAIAARTKSSKATLYRQWQGKLQLVVAALRATKPFTLDRIDTGSLRGDLYEVAERADSIAERDLATVRAVAHAAFQNPELAEALHEALHAPELARLAEIVRRAVDRGEVAAGNPAIEFVPYTLFGAALRRELLDRVQPDSAYLRRYLDAVVLPALTAR
jgi:AcrR family transcriptional regulator